VNGHARTATVSNIPIRHLGSYVIVVILESLYIAKADLHTVPWLQKILVRDTLQLGVEEIYAEEKRCQTT